MDAVHDLWFEVDQIKRDFALGVVTVLLYKEVDGLKQGQSASVKLKISCVERLQIHDTEQVGYYDINQIEVEPLGGVVTITGCIPITITAHVARVSIELVQNPIGTEKEGKEEEKGHA